MLDGAMLSRRAIKWWWCPLYPSRGNGTGTLAGALALQNAEGLAAILLQAGEGAPVIYGAFTGNVDMKTGAPAFGTPEFVRAMQISGQLAGSLGLPLRASNANAANALDAQAVWESAFRFREAVQWGEFNLSCGWMDGRWPVSQF